MWSDRGLVNNTEWVRLVALACLCRGVYEAAAPRSRGPREGGELQARTQDLTVTETVSTVHPEPPPGDLPPQVEGWKRRAVRAYARAQDRKWRNWVQAMYEPVRRTQDSFGER